jgi:hypothetical protein
MVRRCSDKMAKLLLTIFNALFLVCGIVLVILGAKDFTNAKNINAIITELNGVNAVVIGVGVIIVVISFLGCCGALKENACMLNMFLALLMIILIAEIAVGYLAFKNKSKIEEIAADSAYKSLNETSKNELLRQAWDDVQTSMLCCGARSYKDYEDFKMEIPASCCKKHLAPGKQCRHGEDGFNEGGCYPKMKKFVDDHSLTLGVVALLVAFVEVAGIIFACCLRSAVLERYETV